MQKITPTILFKYSPSFEQGICQDLFKKQTESSQEHYPSPDEVIGKKDQVRKIITHDVRKQYIDFLTDTTGISWESEYISVTFCGKINHFLSHYAPLIVTVGWTEDINLLAVITLFEITRYFLSQDGLAKALSVTGDQGEQETKALAFSLLEYFILNQNINGFNTDTLLTLGKLYQVQSLGEGKLEYFLNLTRMSLEVPVNFPKHPLLHFTYDSTYDLIYKNLYSYNALIYNYKNPYPSPEVIFSNLAEPYEFLKKNLSSMLDFIVSILGNRVILPKGYINFYFIGNTKLFGGLAYPPTICARIPDKDSIPLLVLHELIHIIYWFNNINYLKVEKSMSEHLNIHESHSKRHVLIYPVMDEVCKKWPELAKYEGYWKGVATYKELASAVDSLGQKQFIQKISDLGKGCTG